MCISNKDGVLGDIVGVRGDIKGSFKSGIRGESDALGGEGVGVKGGGVGASEWFWMEASSEASLATMAMKDSTGTFVVPSGVCGELSFLSLGYYVMGVSSLSSPRFCQ